MVEDSNDFKQLQRLMALKRHEQPPPGYFHHFSREVIVRIKAGELGETQTKWWAFDGSWLKWFWTVCERRPVLAGGTGIALCGFFVAASLVSGGGDAPVVAVSPSQYVSVHAPLSAPAVSAEPSTAEYSVSTADFPGFIRTSVPQRAQPSSLFGPAGNLQWPLVQPASFHPGN